MLYRFDSLETQRSGHVTCKLAVYYACFIAFRDLDQNLHFLCIHIASFQTHLHHHSNSFLLDYRVKRYAGYLFKSEEGSECIHLK